MKFVSHLVIAAALIAAASFALSKNGHNTPNLLLISVDTLRADHLSAYGYHRSTPTFDRLAKEGVLFEQAISQAPFTTPSHMSLFTSLYPTVHRVTHERLSDIKLFLPKLFQQKGFQSAGFVEATAMAAKFGFSSGFDKYYGRSDDPSAAANNRRVMGWLDKRQKDKPFFLFVHYYDVHRKYEPPAPYNSLFGPPPADNLEDLITGPYGRRKSITFQQLYQIIAAYDGEIRYMDEQLRLLFKFLKERKLYDNTLIVLFSDHGEGFLEHSLMDHGNSLYQELMRVPLIMKFPNSQHAGSKVKGVARLIDVMPTLLDYYKIRTEQMMQGASLLPMISQGSGGKMGYASGGIGSEMITFQKWKLIHNAELEKRLEMVPLALRSEYEMYNLEVDPQEHNNIANADAQTREKLLQMLKQQREINMKLEQRLHVDHKPLDSEMEEQLRALGYLQ